MAIDRHHLMRSVQRIAWPWHGRLLAALFTVMGAPAHADDGGRAVAPQRAPSAPWVGVVDARRAGTAAQIHASRALPRARLSYFRLSDPSATAAQCCLSPSGRANADRGVLRLTGQAPRPTLRAQAVFTTESQDGFVGLAFAGPGVTAERLSPHQVRIAWAAQQRTLDAYHCLSGEGLHVRVVDGSGRELVHYYVYLGHDVEADCTAEVMPRLE